MKAMIKLSVMSVVLLLGVTTAQAQPGYEGILNRALGNGASVYCGACHSGATNAGTAVLPMANTWRSGANLALSDSDGDGFNNAQEVSGGSINFNSSATSPFTLAKAAEPSTSNNVVVIGGGQVSEITITDVYTQAGIPAPIAGHEIVANTSPLVATFPATIIFNKPISTGDKVYVVDFVAKTNTLLTTGVTYNYNGSITVSGVTGPANIVVDRTIPVPPTATGVPPRGGDDDEGGEGLEGCMTDQLSTSIMIFLSMFALGFFVRRKKA